MYLNIAQPYLEPPMQWKRNKTCTAHQWSGYNYNAHFQDHSSTWWQHNICHVYAFSLAIKLSFLNLVPGSDCLICHRLKNKFPKSLFPSVPQSILHIFKIKKKGILTIFYFSYTKRNDVFYVKNWRTRHLSWKIWAGLA